MAFTFDATVGGANANSFSSVEFADDYFAASLYREGWPVTSAGADLLAKQQALVSATRMLDRLTWSGTRYHFQTQRLQFPRVGLYTRDGNYLPSDQIPPELLEATCELALYLLSINTDQIVDESMRQFKHLKIAGVIEFELREGEPTETDLPASVMEMVARHLQFTGQGTTRILRA